MNGINEYILTTSTNAPVWVLRKGTMVDFKETKGPNKGNIRKRKIRYVKGYPTFWDDELPSNVNSTAIEFMDGKYRAEQSDSVLNQYLQIHPEYNENFKLLDIEKDAELELQELELVEDAKAKLRKLDEDMQKAVAIRLFGDRATRGWGPGKVKLALHEYIDDSKTEVKAGLLKPEYFIETIEDPLTQMSFFITQALREELIEVSSDKTSVRWSDGKGVIIPVASGQDPVTKAAEFLLEKDGRATFEEIKKKLG